MSILTPGVVEGGVASIDHPGGQGGGQSRAQGHREPEQVRNIIFLGNFSTIAFFGWFPTFKSGFLKNVWIMHVAFRFHLLLLLVGHSVHFNTAVTSQEIFAKLRIWTKKRARSISHNHIKMMQSMVYLILIFTLILIKWHVTSQENLTI